MVALATTPSTNALAASLERRLGVRRRARTDAANGVPAIDDETCTAEHDIRAAVDADCAPLLAERASVGARLEQALRKHLGPTPDFALLAAQARLPLEQTEARRRSELASLRAKALSERADVDTFRRIERVPYNAKLPDSSLLSTGLLVALMAVEAVASAPIFATVGETGLVNGYVAAVTVSALNAAIGFLGGFFGVRYTAHARAVGRVAGYAAALFSLAAAVGFNVFMAWWRADAAAPRIPGDATHWTALLATGPSVTLLLLGGIVYLMALYEGATKFGESYPGYGKLERHAQTSEDDFRDALEDATDALHAVVDPAIAKINAAIDAMGASVARMLTDYDAAAGRVLDIDAKLRALDATHLALVTLYRQENANARAGGPPRAFLAPPAPLDPPPDVLARAGAQVESAKAAFAAAQASANREIGELVRALQKASARLEHGA
jgi:hypothetical protein